MPISVLADFKFQLVLAYPKTVAGTVTAKRVVIVVEIVRVVSSFYFAIELRGPLEYR